MQLVFNTKGNQIQEFVIEQMNIVVMHLQQPIAEEGPRTETFYAVVRSA